MFFQQELVLQEPSKKTPKGNFKNHYCQVPFGNTYLTEFLTKLPFISNSMAWGCYVLQVDSEISPQSALFFESLINLSPFLHS